MKEHTVDELIPVKDKVKAWLKSHGIAAAVGIGMAPSGRTSVKIMALQFPPEAKVDLLAEFREVPLYVEEGVEVRAFRGDAVE